MKPKNWTDWDMMAMWISGVLLGMFILFFVLAALGKIKS